MVRTSFVYHQITAVISILATLTLFFGLFKYWKDLNANSIAILLLILSLSWGVHGILHFWEEYLYDFDPLQVRIILKKMLIVCGKKMEK